MKKILLLEGSKIVKDILDKHLIINYDLTHINNSDEALDYIVKNDKNIDLIIMDFNLKPFDAYQLIQKIKIENKVSRIPIILLSSDFDQQNIVLGIHAGISGYLIKPFLVRELLEKIDNIFLN